MGDVVYIVDREKKESPVTKVQIYSATAKEWADGTITKEHVSDRKPLSPLPPLPLGWILRCAFCTELVHT